LILIDTAEALRKMLPRIASCESLGADTEADSLHHYYEKMCLLQISTPHEDYVVDPLAGLDLKPLAGVLNHKTLILHGADFDLKMLGRFCGIRPAGVFDTKLAAQFLGYPKPSLAALVEQHFGTRLPKSNQKADWSKRPLTSSMLNYACNDTHYLFRLRSILEKELHSAKRAEWFEETCRAELKGSGKKHQAEQENDWHIKGANKLKNREQVILRELWHWREKEAQRRDRPRFRVMATEQMIRAAQWATAHSASSLAQCPHIPQYLKDRKLPVLEEVVRKAKQMPADSPRRPRKGKGRPRLSQQDKAVLRDLKDERRKIASKLNLDPALVVSNANLERLLLAAPKDISEFSKTGFFLDWQAEVAGERLLGILKAERGSN